MDMRENKRLLTSFILLAIMLVLLFVLNVAFGSRAVAIADIPAILMGSGGGTAHSIIWSIRLPRIVTAMILGGALRDGNDTRRSSGCVRFSASDVL